MTLPPLSERPRGRSSLVRDGSGSSASGLRKAIRTLLDLSMGMSLDYQVAVEEGATMVRIGTALFGPRAP